MILQTLPKRLGHVSMLSLIHVVGNSDLEWVAWLYVVELVEQAAELSAAVRCLQEHLSVDHNRHVLVVGELHAGLVRTRDGSALADAAEPPTERQHVFDLIRDHEHQPRARP